MANKQVGTSAEVYAVIKARHPEMIVFSSFSAPDGDYWGNPEKCVMMTEWGFAGGDEPLIGIRTTWDKNHEIPHQRDNMESKYWLCVPLEEIGDER